jgi:thiamine pyrophosphokinase
VQSCILFLQGTYPKSDLEYYKKRCRGKFLVAVDGGYSFFRKTGLTPQILIGDFDSIGRIPRNLSTKTEVIRYSSHKDKTDIELAVDYCLERGMSDIQIVQPSFGEPDQFVGNLMLLIRAGQLKRRVQGCVVHIINRRYEVCALAEGSGIITGGKGDCLSVVPISDKIVLSLVGTEYDVTDLTILRGESRGLRNQISASRAHVRVRGTALVIRQFAKVRG